MRKFFITQDQINLLSRSFGKVIGEISFRPLMLLETVVRKQEIIEAPPKTETTPEQEDGTEI